MKITCHSCGAKYTISDARVSGRKVKIRCKSCSTTIVVDGTQAATEADSAAASAAGSVDQAGSAASGQDMSMQQDFGEAGGVLVASTAETATTVASGVSVPGAGASDEQWSISLSDDDQQEMSLEDLVERYHAGAIPEDAYVWREGMPDWVPLADVPEIRARLQQGLGAESGASAARPKARVTGGRVQDNADLFGASSQQAALGLPGSTAYDQKPTGARNENSVLFSLDTLKADFGRPQPAAPKAETNAANPFDMGGAGALANFGGGNALFSPAANQALLTAPPPPEPPKPSLARAVDPSAAGAQAQLQRLKRMMVMGGAAAALVLIVGVVLALNGGDDSDESELAGVDKETVVEASGAKDESEAKEGQAADGKSKEEREAKDEAEGASDKQAKADKAKENGDDGADSDKDSDKQAAAKSTATSGDGKRTTASKSSSEKTSEPVKVKVKSKPSAGLGSINMAAVKAQMSQAAAAASGCKKPNGPTGRGKVLVTFATSGRVTSASVAGGGFSGNSVGGCVAKVFRNSKVPAFSGSPVTVAKSFYIPK